MGNTKKVAERKSAGRWKGVARRLAERGAYKTRARARRGRQAIDGNVSGACMAGRHGARLEGVGAAAGGNFLALGGEARGGGGALAVGR
jgi:hypothetical protein